MRAELENRELEGRGVIITSETPEEAEVLKKIWTRHGSPVAFGRLPQGVVLLTVAPALDEETPEAAPRQEPKIGGRKPGRGKETPKIMR